MASHLNKFLTGAPNQNKVLIEYYFLLNKNLMFEKSDSDFLKQVVFNEHGGLLSKKR